MFVYLLVYGQELEWVYVCMSVNSWNKLNLGKKGGI